MTRKKQTEEAGIDPDLYKLLDHLRDRNFEGVKYACEWRVEEEDQPAGRYLTIEFPTDCPEQLS